MQCTSRRMQELPRLEGMRCLRHAGCLIHQMIMPLLTAAVPQSKLQQQRQQAACVVQPHCRLPRHKRSALCMQASLPPASSPGVFGEHTTPGTQAAAGTSATPLGSSSGAFGGFGSLPAASSAAGSQVRRPGCGLDGLCLLRLLHLLSLLSIAQPSWGAAAQAGPHASMLQ